MDKIFKECVADLTMPKGWEDVSYGNDVCPSWEYRGFQVMIHHPDPKERELGFGDDPRFYIFRAQEYGDAPTWNAEAHTFEEVLSILNDEETWHAVARAFVERHGDEPVSLDEFLHWAETKADLHPEVYKEGEQICLLFDWPDEEEDDGNEIIVEEGEFSLQECLEDIAGQLEMGKIDQAKALETMSNIVDSFKREKS